MADTKIIKKFVDRLAKIGVKVELVGNYPWVYLDKVNGINITEQFQAEHGFTAFWIPVRADRPVHFSDMRAVFEKIRSVLNHGHDPVPREYTNYN